MPKLTRALRCCLAALVPVLVAAPALAQVSAVRAVELRGVTYVDAAALALALGDVVTAGDEILTWRGAEPITHRSRTTTPGCSVEIAPTVTSAPMCTFAISTEPSPMTVSGPTTHSGPTCAPCPIVADGSTMALG